MMWCKGKQRGQRLCHRPMRVQREGRMVTEMGWKMTVPGVSLAWSES